MSTRIDRHAVRISLDTNGAPVSAQYEEIKVIIDDDTGEEFRQPMRHSNNIPLEEAAQFMGETAAAHLTAIASLQAQIVTERDAAAAELKASQDAARNALNEAEAAHHDALSQAEVLKGETEARLTAALGRIEELESAADGKQ